ncbi:aminoacyl-tRNA hydrolase [Vitreoscilla massiliensis]|uniref:Peptidyl-tRNA hydrolase n=1 Tax=Vitreoscilla massiliensis TaxID=1689272 RepID=A0ABY4E577_9NEIS|nr:aminoacyl-tRNA hydrolase [Vitreoscilla massiliensis]UOO89478.1 aminoacyl-tRNA hydrolase [Vitreoscilla massiliensis]
MSIQLIVGLGNIGPEYAHTRHNAGWWLLDELAATWGASFREDKKYYAEVAKANTPNGEVWLMKPSTYMNKSGQAVGALANFFKIPVSDLLVLHDELDIPPGHVRLKKGGGNGGHNGLKDIQAKMGSADFWRVRLGIGHPGDRNLVSGYVLNKPSRDDREAIDDAIWRTRCEINDILTGDMEAAMRVLHSNNPK